MQKIEAFLKIDDIIFSTMYLILVLLVSSIFYSRMEKHSIKRNFFYKAILLKISGALIFGCVYLFYYEGGDTFSYFQGSTALSNMYFKNKNIFFEIVFLNELDWNHYLYFDKQTWYPPFYMWSDPNTFSVSRFSSIFAIITSNSFFATTILVSSFSFIGVWKLFTLYSELYPNCTKNIAYLILFMPSLLFWGSGIMKDSFVLSATCWSTYNFYYLFICRKKMFINSIFLLMNFMIILNTKSYVLICLIPGLLIWANNAYIQMIRKRLIKIILIPLVFSLISVCAYFIYINVSEYMGVYGNVDTVVEKVKITQEDLLREEQYGENNYDLGEIDGSLLNLISLAPIAIFTAIFRPLFWEIGSPIMVISVLENTILLFFTIYCLLKISPIKLFMLLTKHPLLLHSVIFSVLFAFGVGIAGTNFGALVRYKIPFMPFLFSTLVIIIYLRKNPT